MALRATRFALTETFSKWGGDQDILSDDSDRNQSVLTCTRNLCRQPTPPGFNGGCCYMRLSYDGGAGPSGPGPDWGILAGSGV